MSDRKTLGSEKLLMAYGFGDCLMYRKIDRSQLHTVTAHSPAPVLTRHPSKLKLWWTTLEDNNSRVIRMHSVLHKSITDGGVVFVVA